MHPLSKILIVEDQFIEANLLRLMLKKAGYTVCGIARSVEDARKKIAEERPELVLLDIFLSGRETGIDLAGYLREEGIAFIYLSASSNEDILHAAKATHPYGFLVKPFRDKDLLITLEIARQHMEYGIESSARKEALFQQQLKELPGRPAGWDQRLLMICQAMQPLVAFDLVSVVFRMEGQPVNSILGFLRMGYGEYRCLSTDDLCEMWKVKKEDMVGQGYSPEEPMALNTGAIFEKTCQTSALDALIARNMGMRARLTLPVPLLISNKGHFTFSFYSRQPYGFTEQHTVLCERMQQLLIYTIENILAVKVVRETAMQLISAHAGFEGIVGQSPSLVRVFDHVRQVAASNTSVLITGESGTGKESIAGSIHHLSLRKKKPFIKVSCAALPVHLIESELFGHEKGAFTGAAGRRIGKFEQADGGTFFLDEIGELPLDVQSKLLRVLQEREIERIGGTGPVKVDVRIIAATNRNLEKEVAEGRFRLDLYYRLNVFPVHMPPLRERAADIPLLAQHFINYYNRENGKKVKGISDDVLRRMQAYHWPGNIRELENLIERGILLEKKGELIEYMDLPLPESRLSSHVEERAGVRTIQENEKEHILAVLKKCEGRIRGIGGAAEILGVPPTTLASKIKKLGIRRQFLALLLLLLGMTGKGQAPKDHVALIKMPADSFLQLSRKAQDNHKYDSGIIYAREAIYAFTQANRPDLLGESYVMLWSNMSLKDMPVGDRIDALKKGAAAFQQAGNKKREGDCGKELGDMLQIKNDLSGALSYLKNALQLYQAVGNRDLAGVYDLLGTVYVNLDDFKEGVRYGLLAAKTAEDANDTSSLMLCTIYNRVGMAYQMAKAPEKAGIYFAKSLHIAEKCKDIKSIAILLNNSVDILGELGKYQEALDLINLKIREYPLLEKDHDFRIYVSCQRVALYIKLKQCEKAAVYSKLLEEELTGDLSYAHQARIYKRLLLFYLSTGDYRKADMYSARFDELCKRLGSVTYNSSNYLYKFKIDSAKGNYISAINNFQRYTAISDSLFDETRSHEVNHLNILYETEKKDKNIHWLEQESELQKSHLKQAETLRNFILGAALLLLAILFLLFKRYKTKQRHQEEISQKNQSLQKLVNEKEWLLKEIHHRVKNNLHMVVGLLASQSEFIKSPDAYMAITESQHRIQAMSLIHQKLYQTENLSSTHMPSYILELVDYLKSSFDKDLPICFKLDIANVDFPLSHSIPIALILNEAIVNAIKYAFPDGRKGEIQISLSEPTKQHFKLRIQDNGVGLPAGFSLTNNSSLGATLMQGLSEDIGAMFTMFHNRGTVVELSFEIQ